MTNELPSVTEFVVAKLALKEGDILVVRSQIPIETGLFQRFMESLSTHVGFKVPVMQIGPDDDVSIITPEKITESQK